jgi:hypothetical protein
MERSHFDDSCVSKKLIVQPKLRTTVLMPGARSIFIQTKIQGANSTTPLSSSVSSTLAPVSASVPSSVQAAISRGSLRFIPEPSPKVVRSWMLLTSLLLSIHILNLWEPAPMTMLSSSVAAVLPSAVVPATSVDLFFSPRIPSLLFPLLQGARLLEPVYRQRWEEFGAVCRTRHISAVEAVWMARRGFIPECHSTPFQFRPPREPNGRGELYGDPRSVTLARLVSHTANTCDNIGKFSVSVSG